MDWKQQAKLIFSVEKPAHFANSQHCCECAEHDQTLMASDVDSIGLDQLGNAGWDPLCFSSVEGLKYYLPAMIRLTLETMDHSQASYIDQMLFHLMQDGEANRLIIACSTEQRKFVADFLEYLVEQHVDEITAGAFTSEDILRAHEMWSPSKPSTPLCHG